jgi:Sec-independent protein secretion pathway component TatC
MRAESEAEKQENLGRRLLLISIFNVGFVTFALLWWKDLAQIVSAPLQWATWQSVSPRPSVFEYPIILLWTLPIAGTALAWLLKQGGQMRLALWLSSFPLIYIGSLIAGFHLIPALMR